jgi:hypothetical protein
MVMKMVKMRMEMMMGMKSNCSSDDGEDNGVVGKQV